MTGGLTVVSTKGMNALAIRRVLLEPDETLRKTSRPVEAFDKRLHQLLDDMAETMYKHEGVGLAAPQVGVLRRAVVIDSGGELIELTNPVILSARGQQRTIEGCLSCPGKVGYTLRPERVTVKAYDRYGKEITIKGTDLLAKALCHEIDHLDGVLFLDKVVEYVEA